MRLLLPPDRGAVRTSARAAVLADWMSGWLSEPVRVDVAPSYGDLALAIERGRVDLAWAPPAICARAHRSVAALLQVVRDGATSCRAALVVRAGSGIRTLADLAGRRASWVDPLSTSGHLMAVAHLLDAGLDPATLFASQRFAGSYRDALGDVIAGRADVASVFFVAAGMDAMRRELGDLAGAGARTLELLCTTAPAPFDALAIPRQTARAAELERQILSLGARSTEPALLLEVCRAERFVRADPLAYARFEAVVDRVGLSA